MIAFTILGLIVFWWWCFEVGYLLAFAAQSLDCLLRVFRLERMVRRDLDVYAGWIAAMDRGAAA